MNDEQFAPQLRTIELINPPLINSIIAFLQKQGYTSQVTGFSVTVCQDDSLAFHVEMGNEHIYGILEQIGDEWQVTNWKLGASVEGFAPSVTS